jgi:hypothetical protein
MAITFPDGVDVAGRRNAIWTPTQTLSIAALAAATSIELICHLTKGTLGVAAETERGTDPRECSTQTYETLGNSTWSVNDLEYVWYPQAAEGDPENKPYETLKPRTPGFLTLRFGVDYDSDLAAGEKVWQFPITVGEQVPKTPEGNAAEKFKIIQPVVVTGPILKDQVLVV